MVHSIIIYIETGRVTCDWNSDCADGYECRFDLGCLKRNGGQGFAFGCDKVCYAVNNECTDDDNLCDLDNGEQCLFFLGTGYCIDYQWRRDLWFCNECIKIDMN